MLVECFKCNAISLLSFNIVVIIIIIVFHFDVVLGAQRLQCYMCFSQLNPSPYLMLFLHSIILHRGVCVSIEYSITENTLKRRKAGKKDRLTAGINMPSQT